MHIGIWMQIMWEFVPVVTAKIKLNVSQPKIDFNHILNKL